MIEGYLKRQGFPLAGEGRPECMGLWEDWYKGYVEDFHRYKVSCGETPKDVKRYYLGMAKTVCQDFGTLLINEKVQITCEAIPELHDILERNHFMARMNRLAERTMALGTGAIAVFAGLDGQPVIDYIAAPMIYPLRWDNEHVTECAVVSTMIVGEGRNTQAAYFVQMHVRAGDGWQIKNALLAQNGKELDLPAGMLPESPVTPLPMFRLVRPNAVNTADPEGPMGASVFADAIEQLKGVDLVYDSYINEFVLGKKRMMVPLSLATVIARDDGLIDPVFDPNDLLFYTYGSKQDSEGGDKLQEVDMHLRTAEHEQGLQRQLDLLSKKCGLGVGRYRFNEGSMQTATEVISSKSDLYQSLKRHEKTFGDAIIGMVKAIGYLLGRGDDVDVSVNFDDSIIEDANATMERVIKLTAAELMSKKRALMEVYKVDEKEAERMLAEINAERAVGAENIEALFGAGERV